MVDVKAVQNLAYEHPDTGFPDQVKDRIDAAVSSGLTKVWRSMLEVAASGFGKGVLITAGVVLAASMLGFGGLAFIGELPTTVAGGMAAQATVDTGVKIGVAQALGFMQTVGGALLLGMGGTLGAVADARKYQHRISAEMAKAEAARLEKMRSKGVEQTVSLQEPVVTSPATTLPEPKRTETGHIKAPNGKAALSLANAVSTGELQLKPNGHAAQEAERRARREVVGKAF